MIECSTGESFPMEWACFSHLVFHLHFWACFRSAKAHLGEGKWNLLVSFHFYGSADLFDHESSLFSHGSVLSSSLLFFSSSFPSWTHTYLAPKQDLGPPLSWEKGESLQIRLWGYHSVSTQSNFNQNMRSEALSHERDWSKSHSILEKSRRHQSHLRQFSLWSKIIVIRISSHMRGVLNDQVFDGGILSHGEGRFLSSFFSFSFLVCCRSAKAHLGEGKWNLPLSLHF